MNNQQRQSLRKLRLEKKITVNLAAHWAQVEQRTWRSWEAMNGLGTARSPSPAALWSFFARSGLKMPPEFDIYTDFKPRGLALAISTYKGGVGKTPITLNVAAALVEQGFRVAIVTDDGVYRHVAENGERPPPGSLVSQIDFYDELDVITFPIALKEQRKRLKDYIAQTPASERAVLLHLHGDSLDEYERKSRAQEKLGNLIARYDYVLMDINSDRDLIRRYANLVAVIVDTNCLMSVQSAESFVGALRHIKCRETSPSYFGLLTHCDVGGVSQELQEFVGAHVDFDDALFEQLETTKRMISQQRERILERIVKLDFATLSTELTSSYRAAIEMYKQKPGMSAYYGYYSSFLDFAPTSHAAREMRRLADELITHRL